MRTEEKIYAKARGDVSTAKKKLIALASYGVGVLDAQDKIQYELHKETLQSLIEEIDSIMDELCKNLLHSGRKMLVTRILESGYSTQWLSLILKEENDDTTF